MACVRDVWKCWGCGLCESSKVLGLCRNEPCYTFGVALYCNEHVKTSQAHKHTHSHTHTLPCCPTCVCHHTQSRTQVATDMRLWLYSHSHPPMLSHMLHHTQQRPDFDLPCLSTHTQVATDTRLWLYSQLLDIRSSLQELISVATSRAEAEADVLMPGEGAGCCVQVWVFGFLGSFRCWLGPRLGGFRVIQSIQSSELVFLGGVRCWGGARANGGLLPCGDQQKSLVGRGVVCACDAHMCAAADVAAACRCWRVLLPAPSDLHRLHTLCPPACLTG